MQQSDAEGVKAAVYAIYAAMSARDIDMMEAMWVHERDVVVINVPDKVLSIGWDAVKKNWQTVFDNFSEVNAMPKDAPHIQFTHGAASTATIIAVHGKNKAGQPLSFSVLTTQVFVKHDDRWLAIAHHASRVPD